VCPPIECCAPAIDIFFLVLWLALLIERSALLLYQCLQMLVRPNLLLFDLNDLHHLYSRFFNLCDRLIIYVGADKKTGWSAYKKEQNEKNE
jgi:hypothetical protein